MIYNDVQTIDSTSRDQLIQLLKETGITDKKDAQAFIKVFFAITQHLAVEELDGLLRRKGIELEKEVIVSSLNLFSRLGYAVERSFEGEDVKRYEPLRPDAHHDHFICVKCNRISEFNDRQLERLQDSLLFERGWKPLFHRLDVYGVCDRCATPAEKAMPIAFAREDTVVTPAGLKDGWRFKKRLIALGMLPDEPIKIIKNSGGGPIVLEVKGARLAIGRGEAHKIMVCEKD